MTQPTEAVVPVQPKAAAAIPTVLYIEDDLSNLTLLRRLVERHRKVTFLAATNGAQGLEMARAHRPDLILLDFFLRDLRGDEVLSQLRQRKETAATPVFIVSGDTSPGRAERLLAEGAQAYITKPLDLAKFFEAIDQALVGIGEKRQAQVVS